MVMVPFGRDAHPGVTVCVGQRIGLRLRHQAHAVGADRDAERHAAQSGEHAAAGRSACRVIVMAQPSLDARSTAAMMR